MTISRKNRGPFRPTNSAHQLPHPNGRLRLDQERPSPASFAGAGRGRKARIHKLHGGIRGDLPDEGLDAAPAYGFLKETALFEESGIIVRVPDWWTGGRPSRPRVSLTIGEKKGVVLGLDSLLDFSGGLGTIDRDFCLS